MIIVDATRLEFFSFEDENTNKFKTYCIFFVFISL